MATRIDTVAARDKLRPRRDPYWQRLDVGSYLGYRKMTADSAGSWVARAVDPGTGKKPACSLGQFIELPAHARFSAASKAAREWFEHLGRGGSASPSTVRQVCARYVDSQREKLGEKAAKDAQARFANYVLNDQRLANLEVSKLTPAHVQAWVKSLRSVPTRSGANRGETRSDSTLNRDITPFRAALNLALDDGLVTSDFAWRKALRPLKNVDKRRELYLDKRQRRALIKAAAPDLAAFLRGLALLPLRPGALAALKSGDFDRQLKVLKIGKDKSGAARKIMLPSETAEFFGRQVSDKLPSAPLLSRADGKAWDKDAWKWPIKAAAQAAGLPAGTTAYTLRHSTISDLVHAGLDLLTVAQISGTSVRMIEQHYGHLRSRVAVQALAKLAV
jgi:integrase